jgi:uncharacterized membrane protein HdeD (DUF308 family)
MTTVSETSTYEVQFFKGVSRLWWVFLVTGVLWIVLALIILTVDPTSVTVIAYMAGAVILLAGLAEGAMTFIAPGWRWLHALLAILFLAGGIAAFMDPLQTFGILAVLIGWWLVLKGTIDIVESLAAREVLNLWGLVLASGIIQILIGLWAIGSPVRSWWLLVLWIGLGALMRGITEIFLAFRVKGLEVE